VTGLFWPTRVCVALGVAVGLLAGLVGFPDLGTAAADKPRTQERRVDHPPRVMRAPVVGAAWTAE
jgi:hypothetical protein